MSTLIVYPDAGTGGTTVDGDVERSVNNATFADLHGGVGTSADPTGTFSVTGLAAHTTSNRFLRNSRAARTLNTSSIGSGQAVSDASWSIVPLVINTALGDDNIVIVDASLAADNNLVAADFNLANWGTTNGGSDAISNFTAGVRRAISFNAYGMSLIDMEGITTIGTRISWDIEAVFGGVWATNLTTRVLEYSADQAGTTDDPFLTVEYDVAVLAPTVTTQAASDIEAKTAVLNGNITDLGTEDVTEWGFYYVEGAGTPTSGDSVISSTGIASTGAYTEAPSGLTPDTLHSARAFATNSVGTEVGAVIQFTTLEAEALGGGGIGSLDLSLGSM